MLRVSSKSCAMAVAFAVLLAGSATAGDREDIAATAVAFAAALDAGDIDAASRTQAPNTAIVDDFAPYHWSGADALKAWWKDFGAFAQANQVTEPSLKFAGGERIEVTGDNAYALFPAVFRFKAAGKPVSARGAVVMAMVRIGQDWKIVAWGWGGPRPS